MIDRVIKKMLNIPSVKAAVSNAMLEFIPKQAEPAQETRPSRRSLVAIDDAYYGVTRDYDTPIAKDDQRTYLELYQKLVWTFRGVNTIATSAARVPLKIWESGKPRKEFRIHPIYKLLDNPNNLSTRFELWVRTLAYLELCGNAYWFIERDNSGLPTKLHLPRPDRVEPVPQSGDNVLYLRRRTARGGNSFTEDWIMRDVVHFSYFNPTSDFQGFPPVAAGQDNAIIELYLILFGKRFFQNAIYPSQMFKASTHLSDATFERFQAELRRLHQGVESFHKVMLLEEDITPVDDRRKTPTDADYIDNRKATREDILTGLGCYQLVALLQGKTGSALREARQMFWEETMLPKLTNLQESISKELLWSNYPDAEELIAEFDTRKIPALRESLLAESLANYRYWQTGVLLGNEIRNEIGIDGETEWGNKPPPTIPYARSRTLPNEERKFLEDSLPHPERYVETIADNVADRLENENGNGQVSSELIKRILSEEIALALEDPIIHV